MYQIGEWVVYGVHGVCRVVGTEKQLVNRKRTQFLVLEPMTQNESRFYLPIENPTAMAKLKAVLSKEELSELFASDDIRQDAWNHEENHRKRHNRIDREDYDSNKQKLDYSVYYNSENVVNRATHN